MVIIGITAVAVLGLAASLSVLQGRESGVEVRTEPRITLRPRGGLLMKLARRT